jgi:chromosome segregation protein
MHIKKLEICGFKSFVDRTVIHFDHDMIGIVGPNGCGKSNVVDSIRWVMGEQSAKALRGKAMGDVIFSGSESRAQGGFAEVTITFDNRDPAMAQSLPLEYREYSELAVTRRLCRGDGSNQYFINKIPVRLRDVTEVFLGTGIGRKAYSIVEQGKIGMIVSARPEDRRILIEEAAGITKYKARKRQAENKMNLTRGNLVRVGDIVSEIERQLGNLKRQAAKAERYARYRNELDDLMLWDASHRLLGLITSTRVVEQTQAEASESVQVEQTNVDTMDAQIEAMRQAMHSAEGQAERTQNAAFSSDNDVRETQGQITRNSDRYEHLQERLVAAGSERRLLSDKAAGLFEERKELEQTRETAQKAQQVEELSVREAGDLMIDLQRANSEANVVLTAVRQRHADTNAAIARSEASLIGFAQRSSEMVARGERLRGELSRLQNEHSDLLNQQENRVQQTDELANRKSAMCDARDALRNELPTLESLLSNRQRNLIGKRDELLEKKSRLAALEELAERMEGVGTGVRNLLQTGDSSLGGLVADRIDVPKDMMQAFAGLVGDRLQCVIVEDLDRALELLRGLANDQQGRASIIPNASDLVSRLPIGNAAQDSWLQHPDVIGLMVDHVIFHADDEAVIRSLVGDAIVCKTAEQARALVAAGCNQDIVTLEGTVFHVDGRVTGGAGDSLAAGILEQKREMRELRGLVDNESQAVETLQVEVNQLKERLSGLREALDQAKSEAHEAEIALVTAQQDQRRLEQQIGAAKKRSDEVGTELDELDHMVLEAQAEHDSAKAALERATTERDGLLEELHEVEAKAQAASQQLSEHQSAFTDRKVQLASARERLASTEQSLTRVQRQHSELSDRMDQLEKERDAAAEEAGSVAARIFVLRDELLNAKSEQRSARSRAESARVELDDARHTLALRDAELRELRQVLQNASQRLQQSEMELQRLLMERSHLEEAIAERFRGLELATVVGDFHARRQLGQEEQNRIRELTRLIDRMGSVNLDAMKEYEESSERYTYYTSQRDDLEKALADLEQAIGQMNRESTRLFKHAYDGISRRFKEIFPKMFRGGKAELRLTRPDDLLESGIEILAQPPGKRLGNLELMSGGEKAFTAVSLLLAIFRFKPSPFCILDEVDAPLDDANIDRYVEAVRAMTDRSQFIVITHSKRTMQAVDVLYGVTMQEPGVSKLVGVRVNEGATRSSKHSSQPPSTAADATAEEAMPSEAMPSDENAQDDALTAEQATAVA